jgi:hypothetical protein
MSTPISDKNFASSIIEYEYGGLTHEQMIELFQYIVDNGLDSILEGHYGREAQRLLDAGLIFPPPQTDPREDA